MVRRAFRFIKALMIPSKADGEHTYNILRPNQKINFLIFLAVSAEITAKSQKGSEIPFFLTLVIMGVKK